MNFTLLAAFLLASLTLSKDLIKGFDQNQIDVYLDIFLVILTLAPCVFNLIYFLRRDCNRWKVFMVNLHKFLRLDSFDEYYRNCCEKGNWYFCGHDVDESLKYNGESVIVLGDIFNTIFKKLETKNNFAFSEFTSEFCLDGDENYYFRNFTFRKLYVFLNRHQMKIKHRGGRSAGFDIDLNMCDDEYSKLYDILNLCEKTGSLGICQSNNLVSGEFNHLMQFQEIVALIKSDPGISFNVCTLSGKRVFEGLEIARLEDTTEGESSTSPFEMAPFRKALSNLNACHKLGSKIDLKFGTRLSNFLFDFTRSHWGHLKYEALDFILNRSSCWRYRMLGTNWQAKRFLCDLNYIYKVSGVPELTHLDRGVNPTRKIVSQTDIIPKCTELVHRSKVSYTLESACSGLKSKNGNKPNKSTMTQILKHSGALKDVKMSPNYKICKAVSKFLNKSKITVDNSKSLEQLKPCEYKPYRSDYRDAVLKKTNFIRREGISPKTKSKILDRVLLSQNKSKLNEIKEIISWRPKTSDHDGFVTVKNVKKFFTKEAFELKLGNYFDVLEEHVETVEKSKFQTFSDEEANEITHGIYNPNLGFGKQMHNLEVFLRLSKLKNFNGSNLCRFQTVSIGIEALKKTFNQLIAEIPQGICYPIKNINRVFRFIRKGYRKRKRIKGKKRKFLDFCQDSIGSCKRFKKMKVKPVINLKKMIRLHHLHLYNKKKTIIREKQKLIDDEKAKQLRKKIAAEKKAERIITLRESERVRIAGIEDAAAKKLERNLSKLGYALALRNEVKVLMPERFESGYFHEMDITKAETSDRVTERYKKLEYEISETPVFPFFYDRKLHLSPKFWVDVKDVYGFHCTENADLMKLARTKMDEIINLLNYDKN